LTGAARADLWAPPGTTVNCDILAFGDCTCTLLASPTGIPAVLACAGKICKEVQITAPVKLLVPTFGFCDVPACTFLPQPGFTCPSEPLFPPERCQATPTVTMLAMGGIVPFSGNPVSVFRLISGVPTLIATHYTNASGVASFPEIGGLEGALDAVSFSVTDKVALFPIPIEFFDIMGVAHDSATVCSIIFTQIDETDNFAATINGFLVGSGTPGVPLIIDPR
jgi:hypothetical protein